MPTERVRAAGLILAMLLVVSVVAQLRPAEAAHGDPWHVVERVNVASDGTEATYPDPALPVPSRNPSISADGRYVAFESQATNLVPDDTNDVVDVFVHDRQTGQTTRVSVASDGTEGNATSARPSLSGDGRFVAFASIATNLVTGDTNDRNDVFVHDRLTGQTTRVSVATDDVEADGNSFSPAMSADGRFVAFLSGATNLVPGDTNGVNDVFIHDRMTGGTTRVSVASGGTEANDSSEFPSLTSDGRFVAFGSLASNLVAGDTNDTGDVFVHDRLSGQTTRVSVASDGTQGNVNGSSTMPSLSGDGRYVAFTSFASNLVAGDTNNLADIFVHDRQTGQTTRVSVASDGTEAQGDSEFPRISADGHFVVFHSSAANLAPGDGDLTFDTFVHDRLTGHMSAAHVNPLGIEGNGASFTLGSGFPAVSGDGRYIAFDSSSDNLVPNDTNRGVDVFVAAADLAELIRDQPALSPGGQQSLIAKLTAARSSHERGNPTAACNQLAAFLNQLQMVLQTGQVDPVNGAMLLNGAEDERRALGCPAS